MKVKKSLVPVHRGERERRSGHQVNNYILNAPICEVKQA
jgi:hypothetical protein